METSNWFKPSVQPEIFGVYKGIWRGKEWFSLFDEKGWHSGWEKHNDAENSAWYPIDEPEMWCGLASKP